MKRCLLVAVCAAWAVGCGRGETTSAVGEFVPEIQVLATREASVAPFSLTASDGTGLVLESVDARVVIEPPLSFTQLELAFKNPQPHRLEGRLELVLPPGASISRLALQIGEHFEEGEVVERPRAVVAYEEALHGRRDPALLEHDAGNEYRMRIFPIEGYETKRVIVSYSQLATDADRGYRMHLAGLPRVKHFRVEVSGSRARDEPVVFERRAWMPNGDVFVPLPELRPGLALASDDLALVYVSPAAESTGTVFERMTVLFDTSASSAPELVARAARMRALLAAIEAERGAPFPVQLVVFDQEVLPLLEARSDQLGPQLDEQLRARGALGATDLEAALRALPELGPLGDRVLVYSDGIATAGETSPSALAEHAAALAEHGVRRIDAVQQGSRVDFPLLEALVHAQLPEAGVIVADREPRQSAAARLLRGTRARVPVRVDGAHWTYPEVLEGVEPGRVYPVFAKLAQRTKKRTLRVDGAEIAPRALKGERAALLEREWARVQIAFLQRKLRSAGDADFGEARAEIVELSMRERVLSEHTAWVVLESERDYERHGIARSTGPRMEVKGGALASTAAKANVEAAAKTAGIIGMIGGPGIGTIGHGPIDTAAGMDPTSALGALLADNALGGAGLGMADARGGLGVGRSGGWGSSGGKSFRGRDSHEAHISAESPRVRGKLSEEVVRRVVHRHLNELRFCYEQRLPSRPGLEGSVAIQWIISPTGTVSTAAIQSSSAGDSKLERCMTTAVQRWTFPSPEEGIAVVSQTFELSLPWGSARTVARLERVRERRAQSARLAEAQRVRELRWRERKLVTAQQSLSGVLLEVVEQIERGESHAALARARVVQAAAPQDTMALLALARAATANGEPDLAARAYGSLIDLFPSRAEYRRAAGQALESLGGRGLALALDSYRKAVELRPDHPSGYRLLALASWRAGDRDGARLALHRGEVARLPWDRFPGVKALLDREWRLIASTARDPLLRVCLYWETDVSDVDLRVFDGEHRLAVAPSSELQGDLQLETSVRAGLGPECFTASGGELAYPYTLEAQLMQRAAGGDVLGAAHILQIDRQGTPHFEMRPFAMMNDRALVSLGEVASPDRSDLAMR